MYLAIIFVMLDMWYFSLQPLSACINLWKIQGEPLHTQEIKTPQFMWWLQGYAHGGDDLMHIIIHTSSFPATLSRDFPSTQAHFKKGSSSTVSFLSRLRSLVRSYLPVMTASAVAMCMSVLSLTGHLSGESTRFSSPPISFSSCWIFAPKALFSREKLR